MVILGLLIYHAIVTRCGVRNGTCLCGMAGYEPHRAHQTAQVGGNDGFNNVNLNQPDFDDHPEPTE